MVYGHLLRLAVAKQPAGERGVRGDRVFSVLPNDGPVHYYRVDARGIRNQPVSSRWEVIHPPFTFVTHVLHIEHDNVGPPTIF